MKKKQVEFVVKRAFRVGEVRRSDVIEAFNVSAAGATGVLNEALACHPTLIQRTGNLLVPRPVDNPPHFLSDAQLLIDLDAGHFAQSGVRDRDAPISKVDWTNPLPPRDGDLTALVHAIKHEYPVEIFYVGLKVGDNGAARLVYPIGLEKRGESWRLVAHDLTHSKYPIKTFVLPRILSVTKSRKRRPNKIGYRSPLQAKQFHKRKLNPLMTSAQRQAIIHQYDYKDGGVKVPERLKHEFEIEFCGGEISENIVWPPFVE